MLLCEQRFILYLNGLKPIFSYHTFKSGHTIKLLQSGAPYFDRLFACISKATYEIHLQVYIFDEDETGKRVIQLLIDAARRGVKVFVVVDAFGTDQLSKETILKMQAYGIQFREFSPLFTSGGFHLGRRLHHKIALFDEEVALVGGINIADKYHGTATQTAWLDFAVEIRGPVIAEIRDICLDIWQKKYDKLPAPKIAAKGGLRVRLIQNDWLRRKVEISGAYRQTIRRADKELILVASYFLPGIRIRYLLKRAQKRGVKITILLGGVSDVPSVQRAGNYLYGWMLKNNITIYEWKPSVLHGKLAIADEKWVTIGSYNINFLSDYGSLELNVEVVDKNFARQTRQTLQELITEGCEEITPDQYEKRRTILGRILDWISYQLIRTSFKIMYLLMHRE